MANKTLKFVLVKNALPTAKEPYLGQFVSNGTTALDAFAEKICAGRTNIDAPTLKLILQTAFTYIAEDMAENVFRYSTGLLTFEPAIEGSLPSMDAALGADNALYVAVRVAAEFLREIGAMAPGRDAEDSISVKIDDVLDVESETRQQVTGKNRFQITGKNISASLDGEMVEVMGGDGEKVACSVVEEDGMGQRLVAEATKKPAIGKGYVLLTTRGYATPDADPILVKKQVTVVAPMLEPGPHIESLKSRATRGEGEWRVFADVFDIEGYGFDPDTTATLRLVKRATGQEAAKVNSQTSGYNVLKRESDEKLVFTLDRNSSAEPDGSWLDNVTYDAELVLTNAKGTTTLVLNRVED